MFVGASCDIEYILGAEISTDPGGTISIFSLSMFFGASHDIEYIIGVSIETELGGKNLFLF